MLFKSSFPTLLTLCKTPLQCFETFRNCCLFCTFWFLRNFYSGNAHCANYGERCSNHHFRHCAQFVYHIYSVFKIFEIAVCFAQFGFYEISWNFRHCTHCVYYIYSVLKLFKIAVYFAQFRFYEISTPVMRTMLTMMNVVQIILFDIAHTVYIAFKAFWYCSKLLFVLHIWLLRNFYSGDTHHPNYGQCCSNHHFRHCAHCV